MNIDIWSDIACPWCFIGKRRFEKALAEFPHKDQVTVTWHSFQLDPSLPEHYDGTELEYLSQRKGMAPAQVERMFEHVTQVAAAEGLDYDFTRIVVANSFPGHELLHLAKARGAGTADAVNEALLSAHFEKGLDIGDRDVLTEVGLAAGLTKSEITEALDSGTYRDAVHADIREAQMLGIQGVPFFVFERKYGVSGAQPSETFAEVLDTVWRESNPLVMVGDRPNPDELNGEVCGPDGC